MTVGITCKDCGAEVVFALPPDSDVMKPREECDCGAVYELNARKVK